MNYIKFDFVAGLNVRSEPGGEKEMVNSFQNMVMKGRLDRNLSSLNLPREEGDLERYYLRLSTTTYMLEN